MKSKKEIFKPKKGQVDYTHIRYAPVINCLLRHKGKILLVERSKNLRFYPGCWNGISGFLDDNRSIEEKVMTELREELGIRKKMIKKMEFGVIFRQEETKYKKTWIVHPVLVDIKTDTIKIDWEARGYAWVKPKDIRKRKLLPGFFEVLSSLGF
jgi:isopentenyldiphosphate isomerase